MASAATGLTTPEIAARPFLDAADHLLAELERIALLVHAEVLRIRALRLLNESQFRGLYIDDEQIDAILYAPPHPNGNGSGPPKPEIETVLARIAVLTEDLAARRASTHDAGIHLPLDRLATLYHLSPFQQDALLIVSAPDLDPRFEALYSYAQNDVTRKRATVGLVLRLLAPVSAADRLRLRTLFAPSGTLLAIPLLHLSDDAANREAPFLSRLVLPEERILGFLLQQPELDSRLRPFTTLTHPDRALSSLRVPAEFAAALATASASIPTQGAVLFFHGPRGSGKRAAAEALTSIAGVPLLTADLRDPVAAAVPELPGLLRREALLTGANLFLAHADALLSQATTVNSLLLRHSLPGLTLGNGRVTFVTSASPWPTAESTMPSAWTAFPFPTPGFPERSDLWQDALSHSGLFALSGLAPSLANQFVLTGGQIHSACHQAAAHAQLRGHAPRSVSLDDLQAAARAQCSHTLNSRAVKVATGWQWSDLVLPPRTLQQLREICAAEKHRSLIYRGWGFDQRVTHGNGLNVLFSGPSGTGKTMSAGILAVQLGLDLFKIDLSSVVSKYIGETEKQLSEIFREAEASNAILFFDEADAIFGKRSEVKDAHDRYANIEVAYLLQKMEEYEGIVILATNFRKNIDDAFTRRIQHLVEFPFPEAPYRESIWRNLVPAAAPLAPDVDFAFLGRQFELAGGNIRNAVLSAAFLAADEGTAISMEHFVLATARELQKMGKLPSRSDFRHYYDLTRDRT